MGQRKKKSRDNPFDLEPAEPPKEGERPQRQERRRRERRLSPPPGAARLARLRAGLALLFLAIAGVLVAVTAQYAIGEREQALLGAEQRAANLVRVLEEHAARAFGEANTLLLALAENIEGRGGPEQAGEAALHALLVARQQGLSQLGGIFVSDGSGRVVAHSMESPVRALSIQDRDFFQAHRRGEERLVIGRVAREALLGRWAIPASRPIAGEPPGVIVAEVNPMYFENLFRELDLPEGSTIGIIHRDGRMLARHPGSDEFMDRDMSDSPIFQEELKGLQSASYTLPWADGKLRISAFRRLAQYPLVVSVGVPMEAALGPWRKATLVIALGTALLALLIGTVLLLLYAELRRRADAESALRRANQTLEERIRERTTALEHSNQQLAAFSYSVSHDLRSPLRAINGFCQALEEDYGETLDADGKSHLRRVRRASERMGALIDSLVELTSLSRATVHRGLVDLSAMVAEIARDLTDSAPARRVDFDIAPDLRASADPKLTRILLTQLMDNAWKFTRDVPRARISFGLTEERGENVFYVDDNGIGFDMSHATKLFAPFHRLHSTEEFDGFGIGLATVKHIVELHGGRVWADAIPGKGVAVYFTLGPESSPRVAAPTRQEPPAERPHR